MGLPPSLLDDARSDSFRDSFVHYSILRAYHHGNANNLRAGDNTHMAVEPPSVEKTIPRRIAR